MPPTIIPDWTPASSSEETLDWLLNELKSLTMENAALQKQIQHLQRQMEETAEYASTP